MGAGPAVTGLVQLLNALTLERTSRFDIAGRAAVDLTPETIMAQSLQSGFVSPKGLTRQSLQNSLPHRRQTAVADSKLWSRHLPVN